MYSHKQNWHERFSELIGVKVIDTNKWLNDLFNYSNIFAPFFSPKYGDSSDSGEFGDFCDDGKTVDSGESEDSCEYGDSSEFGKSGECGDSG